MFIIKISAVELSVHKWRIVRLFDFTIEHYGYKLQLLAKWN